MIYIIFLEKKWINVINKQTVCYELLSKKTVIYYNFILKKVYKKTDAKSKQIQAPE